MTRHSISRADRRFQRHDGAGNLATDDRSESIQRAVGNQAMLQLVGKGRGGGGLGLSEELEGHAAVAPQLRHALAGVVAQREPGTIQRAPNITTVSPIVIFRDPTVVRKPAAQIASAHGQPGAVGWTTPRYDLTVPSITRNSIEVKTVINWTMELDSAINDHRLDVLRDHEDGHVMIGKTAAQKHFGDNLSSDLSAMSDFSQQAPIRTALTKAATGFSQNEGQSAKAYDSMDYPRMVAAYEGARLTYPQLVAKFPKIGRLGRALWAFNALAKVAQPAAATVSARSQAVLDAVDALDPGLLARAQYSRALAAAATAAKATAATLAGSGSDLVAEVGVALGGLKWNASMVVGGP